MNLPIIETRTLNFGKRFSESRVQTAVKQAGQKKTELTKRTKEKGVYVNARDEVKE